MQRILHAAGMPGLVVGLVAIFGVSIAHGQPMRDGPEDRGPTGQSELSELPPQQQLPIWMARAAGAWEHENYDNWLIALENLHRLRPHNQDIMAQLVTAYALTDAKPQAFDMMLRMQQQGLSQDWDANPHLDNLRIERLYDYLNDMMKQAGEPFGDGEVIGQLEDVSMPEALTHDPATDRYFLGTVRDGQVLVSDDLESWEVLLDSEHEDGIWSVFDLAVDSERKTLWIATGVTRQYRHYDSADSGKTALIRVSLESGEVVSRHPLDIGGNVALLGSLALADDGTVYAADSINPLVFRLKPEAENLELLFQNPNIGSLRGMALSGDQRLLYLADYELGVFIIDLEAGQAYQLVIPDELNLGGVDGLFWWEGHLVAIQNGISPQRVLRLELGDDGLGVVNILPLEASHPAFDQPTYGVLVDNSLIYLAGNHWNLVDERGEPRDGESLPDIALVRTEVDSEESAEVIGQRELREQLMRQQQRQRQEGGQ